MLKLPGLLQGMGEGEGAKDVSEEIENEDQLLGAKQRDAPEEEKVRLNLFFPKFLSPFRNIQSWIRGSKHRESTAFLRQKN